MGDNENADTALRERLLRLLSLATFLIFFQAYMVAPLIPRLSTTFDVSAEMAGVMVPAYLLPYGASTLFYGILADRIGRRRIMLASLCAFVLLTAATATAHSIRELVVWRFLTGLGASGVVPLALALMGRLFSFEQRGRPLGWLFGAMAGGMAFGSTFGALLEPLLTWRGLFLAVGILGAIVAARLLSYQQLFGEAEPDARASVGTLLTSYRELLTSQRGRRTYLYVLLNAIFHSGIYTWLGVYFAERYGFGEIGIGLALLGYGIPGFFLGPVIGRAADCWGRSWLVPSGLAVAGLAALFLALDAPVLVAALFVTALSLGYDMTQPLLAGIVTTLGGKRSGQAMGLNVFTLFTGFGVGSLIFSVLLRYGFDRALIVFALAQLAAALPAVWLFRSETGRALTGQASR